MNTLLTLRTRHAGTIQDVASGIAITLFTAGAVIVASLFG